MSFWRIGDTGILMTATNARAVNFAAAPPPPPPGAIVPAVMVTYVDSSGVRQTVNALDPEVTISGVAPLLLHIDATGTRTPTAFDAYAGGQAIYTPASYTAIADSGARTAAAQEAFAFLEAGYLIDYDGGAGAGNWAYPEHAPQAKNQDRGHPVWPVAMTETGTRTVRLQIRDNLANETIVSFDVTVAAAASTAHIAVADGAWPALVNGRRYTLDAGGDYQSFGTLNTGDAHNVSFERTGAGADPRIATWDVDPRSKFGETTFFPTRARHVRMVGIDVNVMQEGQRGFDFCGVVGGRVRRYSASSQRFFFDEGNSNEQSACRYARGCFFVGCELNNIGASNGYTLFGTWHGLHILGSNVNAIDTGSTTWLVMRTYGPKHSFRHSKVRISHTETGSCGTPLSILSENGVTEAAWPDNDRPAAIGSSDAYGLRNDHSAALNCQFYDSTSSRANAVFSTGGNPAGTSVVRPWLNGQEDCVYFPSGAVGILASNLYLSGRALYIRNVRRDMGAGSYLTADTNNPNDTNNPGNTDDDWDGPYLTQSANTRPVPSGF